jgi:hypothetical protein
MKVNYIVCIVTPSLPFAMMSSSLFMNTRKTQQIHMKWVMDSNKHPIEHLAFVVIGEKIRAHWGEVCPSTHSILPITKSTFAHVVQLAKAK